MLGSEHSWQGMSVDSKLVDRTVVHGHIGESQNPFSLAIGGSAIPATYRLQHKNDNIR